MGILDSAQDMLGSVSQKITSAASSLNPSAARKAISGLLPGVGAGALGGALGSEAQFFDDWGPTDSTGGVARDWRVKVGLPVGSPVLYNDGNEIMRPILNTNGVIFPYTPSISVSHKANYQPQRLTHSNYAAYFYEGSEINQIQIQGDFTVQNQIEGQYLFAAIHFFRAATKMFFGNSEDKYQGNPPPILQLDGYGEPYFPKVKCVITDFTHTMPGDVDYMDVKVGRYHVRLPTTSQVTVVLQPVYSRKNVYDNFTMGQFVNGQLIDKGFI